MPRFFWTPERVDRLRQLNQEGKFCKEIKDILSQEFNHHITIDSIENIKKVHRIFTPRIKRIRVKEKKGMAENDGFISLEKIKTRFDIKTAIFSELEKIPKGKLIAEIDLCQKSAGTDRNRFRRTVENNADEFKPYRVRLRLDDSSEGKWYWGNAEDIAEALRIRDL